MKTSKKLLSLFLAVVMVVTTCSVGFTAFAAEDTTTAYWTDKNKTDADDAFQSLNNLVDYLIPTLLAIEINDDQTLADVLGINDAESATLSDVVKGASPLLMGVLGVAKASDDQKKQIIMDHLGVTSYNGMYDNYFSYLNDDSSSISFFDLYQFCKDNKTESTDKKTLGGWCNETLKTLDTYLNLYDAAAASITKADAAYTALKADKTIEKTAEKKYNGIAYADLADSTKNPTSYADYQQGIDNAKAFFNKLGVNVTINTPADALYYYYSADAQSFVNGLITVYLANGEISDAPIDTAATGLTTSNVMSVLEANVDAYAATHSTGSSMTAAEFIADHLDIITETGITYTDPDTQTEVTLAPVRDMTADEAAAEGKLFSGKAYPLTGWPVQLPSSEVPKATDDIVKNDPYGAANSPHRYYFYYNPGTGKVVRLLKSNSATTAQNAIAKPYLDAYLIANADVNKVEMYGNMLRDCYMNIASSDNGLGVYRSSKYDVIIKNTLEETGVYEDVEQAIDDAKINDNDINAAAAYAKENGVDTNTALKEYLNSANNAFSAEASAFMLNITEAATLQALANALNKKDPAGNNSTKSEAELFKAVAYDQTPYNLHGVTTVFDAANYSVSSIMLLNYIGGDKIGTNNATCSAGTKTANAPIIFKEIYKYSIIAPKLNNDDNKFQYTGALEIPSDFAVELVNATINGYVNTFLDPEDSTGSIITGIVGGLLESDVDLQSTLNDVWKNLAESPIETVFNLLPIVTIALDELLVPILFNQGEITTGPNAHEKDAYFNLLYDALFASDGLLQIPALQALTLEAGNTAIGISKLSFDLNAILPGLLEWFKYNDGSDAKKAVAFSKANTYVETYAERGYDIIIEKDENGDETIIHGEDVLSFTGIYVADKALMGANLGTSFIRVLTNAGLDKNVATGLNEILEVVVDIADSAVLDYTAEQTANPDVKYTTDGIRSTEGLNDIFTALPQLIDRIGKELLNYFNVDSDWTYCFDGKLYKSADKNGNMVLRNLSLTDFKDTASSNDPATILNTFVNIFIGHQLNAFIDLFNDIFADENNDITKNVPLVQALLEALGGLGNKSIITDVLDGLFQLKRADKVSFELKERATGFVGFSTESGIYLIANIFSNLDKDNAKKNAGIVPFILNLVGVTPTNGSGTLSSSKLGASKSAPLLTLSNKNVDFDAVLTKSNIKAADELISKLDTLLASLLKNTTINGFDLTATDSILSGVISAVSNYIGEKNTNELVDLIDLYLKTIVGDNKSSKNGKVDKNKVYTSKKLSTLVIETYSLIENIADYLLKGALGTKDPNGILADAISGIISPDAVGVRMGSDYSTTSKILLKKTNLTWADVKKNNPNLKYGFSDGNKKSFYNALGESLGGISAIVGAVLTATYTDMNKSGNLYSAVIYPVFKSLADATGATGVMSPSAFNKASDAQKLIGGIVTPLASILDQLYKAPASFLMNTLKGLAGLLTDKSITSIINGALGSIKTIFTGVENLVGTVSPTLKKVVKKALDDAIVSKLNIKLAKKNVLATLISNISIGDGETVGDIVKIESIDFEKLSKASSPAEVLLIIYAYVVDNALKADILMNLLEGLSPQIAAFIKNYSAADVLSLLTGILSVVQSPTEVYWTFSEYAGKITNTFVYPKTITNAEANNAVDQLDGAVSAVFALLKDLGVVDIDGLGALVNDNLYTNKLLTTIATAVYGALEKNDTIVTVLGVLGLDLSPAGFAAYLTDSSYGNTYSDAAAALKKAGKWSNVKTLNWGFKDGSAKAETGFVNGIAALLRPVNSILAVLLASGDISLSKSDISDLVEALNLLDVNEKFTVGDGDMGCILTLKIKNGVLTLVIDANNSKDNSTVKLNIANVAKDFLNTFADKKLYLGSNGYESAVIPLLEAFMCDGVKTYDQYIKDYKNAKDNLIIDVLKPLTGFIGDVVDAPFDTVTKVLPNVAYFIDSNGLTQAIGNLLAPITAKTGLLGILAKNGIDVDEIITAIAGKSLGKIVTDALDVNVKLTLDLGNLKTCNIQDIVYPLVSKLLKDELGLTLPKFDFATIASHGTIKVVKSAAKNDEGKYTTRQVEANQGEVLVAVLRYVADVLIKNATPIKKLLTGIDAIKKNATIKNIIDSVFGTIMSADKDDIVRAIFYLLTNEPTDNFFDYSNFVAPTGYSFSFGDMDEDFCRKLAPMLDGLVNGLLAEKGGLNGLIGGLLYKDDLIGKLATGLYGAVEGVSLGDAGSLTGLLAHFDIDFSTANVAALLTNEKYGQTYAGPAGVISRAGSWKNVKAESLSFGVKDRKTFENALCAVLRPLYPVLDVFLNDRALNLANIASVPGSDCYTSVIVPLLEAFGCYNIKTQYQYREDIAQAYDAILLDILDPLLDKVEDILYAPIEMVADMLPNLALFFANDGLLQVIDNLLTPVTALLDALKPIVDVNDILNALGFNINSLLAKTGLNLNINLDLYNLKDTLRPLIGADNVVGLLNKILGIINIKGSKLGIVLPEIDWLQLASHGKLITNEASQAATIGARMFVQADQDETLIAVLRFVVNTINYQGNYDAIVNLLGGLLGGLSDNIAGVVDQVLGMLKGDADEVITNLVDFLQEMAG